jgi:hypothetical protein
MTQISRKNGCKADVGLDVDSYNDAVSTTIDMSVVSTDATPDRRRCPTVVNRSALAPSDISSISRFVRFN